jgi:hypothetical protein
LNKNNFQNWLIIALGLFCITSSGIILYSKIYLTSSNIHQDEFINTRSGLSNDEVISMLFSSLFDEDNASISESAGAQEQLSQIIKFLVIANKVELFFAVKNIIEDEALDINFERMITLASIIKESYPSIKCKISLEIAEDEPRGEDLFTMAFGK